ncbi:MAG: ParB N-terminal domain-containing protein [Hamadaea sp.]|nr:ParB N-terminal domain-containing protein [Hamadaea sp.]
MGRIDDLIARIGAQIDWVAADVLKDGLSPRLDGLTATHVQHLAELDQDLPPLVVHRATMRVVDGAHRLAAARKRDLTQLPVVYFDGTDDEAFVLAVRLNVVHGKALRPRDRSAAARRILQAQPEWSDRWIASVCGVAPRTVAALRGAAADDGQRAHTRVGRDGRRHPLSAEEGRRSAAEIMRDEPGISLRQVAQRAGVSVGTALDVRRRMLTDGSVAPTRVQPTASLRAVQRWSTPDDAQRRLQAVRDHLEWLTREPSLRYSDRGRALLRLVSMTFTFLDNSGPVMSAVPDHCRPSLQTVARSCALSWLALAEQLEAAEEAQAAESRLGGAARAA